MSELLKLAERCEKAAGPDRELDRLIEETMPDVRRHPYDDMVKDGYVILGSQAYLAPHYTGSLDAAMTLVPEGYAIVNFTIWPGHQSSIELLGTAKRKFGREQTIQWVHDRADGRWLSKAATPALTLCAVALHARASAEE